MQDNYDPYYQPRKNPVQPTTNGGPGRTLGLLVIFMAGFVLAYSLFHKGQMTFSSLIGASASMEGRAISQAPGPLSMEEQSTIEIFKQASPSVVFITSISQQRDFFTMRPLEIPQGTGSGFVWDEDGSIVTNFHVIYGADKVSVTLMDQTVLKAEVRGVDPDHDLAVLRVITDRDKLRPLKIGQSHNLQVGQKVLAIGNPFGLDSTLTTGIISALGRSIRSMNDRMIHGVVQTDAAINPGNSGGPLLDSFGRLIGINTAIVSPSGVNAGIGFAVPVDTINRVVPQLITKGKISVAGLGVVMFSDEFLERYRIQGALIRQISPGSAADKAGLKGTSQTWEGIVLGDVIVAIEGKEISNSTDLTDVLTDRQVGETVTIDYVRNKKKYRISVVLQEI